MYKFWLSLSLAVLTVACTKQPESATVPTSSSPSPVANQPIDQTLLINESKEAVQMLGGQLQQSLAEVLKSSGTVQAITVCHTQAPAMAKAVSHEKGLQISRVSLKNRNPTMGTPSDWQTSILHTFEQRKANGEEASQLVYAEVVGNEFRFMKAIPTAQVCLQCHGSDLKPEVLGKLKEVYPADKATGFKEGDLRGAFVVVKNLSQ